MNKLALQSSLPVLAALLLTHPLAARPANQPGTTTPVALAGLEQPAEILIDKWGVPHIYAASVKDAFFLQGYNAARDRLWQIDLWRKRGLGLLARDFGPSYVAQDRAARLFLYRGAMDAEWRSYGPNAKNYAEAFVAGINAYVGEIEAGRAPLPREFSIAGTRPDRWGAEDVVRIRSHGLSGNVEEEVARARTICKAGLAGDAYRQNLEPKWTTKVPEGIDPCSVPEDVLKDYDLGTRSVSFTGLAKVAEGPTAGRGAIGSNNWVIRPERSATGRPILASDPHRAHAMPSLRYIVHMNAPGFSVIGAGEPALPGISIGHNGRIAFGLTIFAIDQEDLYSYELDTSGTKYRYGSGWEPIQAVIEEIEVKGQKPRKVILPFTRHGPVLQRDTAQKRAWALRTVWLQPGTSAYFGASDYMTSKNWTEFLASMDRWGAPGENQVFADTQGNIGWVAAGMVPRRTNYDGLLPVPGDGRYEWKGFLSRKELPSEFNPVRGWIATANEMNLPADYPVKERRIGFEWADASRYRRISEMLDATQKSDLEYSMALQNDTNSPLMRDFVQLIKPLALPREASAADRKALDLVREWNGSSDSPSAAAMIAELWLLRYLPRRTTALLYPDAAGEIGRPATSSLLATLQAPDARFGADAKAARDQLLVQSLADTVKEISSKQGADPVNWRFDRFYQARFIHALEGMAKAKGAEHRAFTTGPFPGKGTWSSPIASSYTASGNMVSGASFRMVLDVGDWDNSRAMNTPGQGGSPSSKHATDLAPLWAAGQYFPLAYTRASVEAVAEERIHLVPKR